MIRGHIRNSFKDKRLYQLIKTLSGIIPDIKIYIHTWSIVANNLSWRQITVDHTDVNKQLIYDYFDDLKSLIYHISIDDDSKIKLKGNLNGKINKGRMPIKGWKNYWYGKNMIIDSIFHNNNIPINETVVNIRFDILDNSFSPDENTIVEFIRQNNGNDFLKNVFLFNDENHLGIDNIYIGNKLTMHQLISCFHNNLDHILKNNNDTCNQEKLVFRINSRINYKTF